MNKDLGVFTGVAILLLVLGALIIKALALWGMWGI